MEVPPGRVERIADGGPEVIRSILAELRAMKFNGVLKTSVFRGDTPSQGVLVLRRGDGVLAEHRSAVDVAGHEALPEILKDAASARAQLEVRTYDYGHSSISIDHLQRSYPEAAVEGIGDPDEVLEQAIAQEARERETYEKELEGRRNQERTLVDREEELYRRKWELEQEYQRSAMRQRELDSLRAELQTVKEASGLILSRLEERRGSRDVEVESQKKVLAMESGKGGAGPEGQGGSLSERQAKPGGLEREFASKEATYRDRETSLDARAASLERERKQMNDLYANLQAEAEKISEARKVFDDRLGEAERRERLLTSQEQAIREREQKLRYHVAAVSQRERTLEDREKSFPRSMADLEAREAELAEKSAKLAKQAEAFEAQDAGLDDQREELERATKRMQKLAKDLTAKDRKVSEEEREARERQADVPRGKGNFASRGKELEQLKRRLERMDEELSANRSKMKAQAVKLLRSERTAQQRLQAIETADRELDKREAAAKRREAAIEKREKAAVAAEERTTERSDAAEVVEGDLRSRRAALEEEYAAKRVELERRESEVAAAERALTKESESNESLKATLEEQETAFLSDLHDIESRKAALAKSEASHAQETKKLEKRSDAISSRESKSKQEIQRREALLEAGEREVEAQEAALREKEESLQHRIDEVEDRESDAEKRVARAEADGKRRQEAVAAQRAGIEERLAKLAADRDALAAEHVAVQGAQSALKTRETKLKDREAPAAKADVEVQRRQKEVAPGVGTKRRAIVCVCEGAFLVGPDNGLLVPAARRLGLKEVREITNRKLGRPELSDTFHGRDLFAPVAAHLMSGTKVKDVGATIRDFVDLDFGEPKKRKGGFDAVVITYDRFGNVVTNIPRPLAEKAWSFGDRLAVTVGGYEMTVPFVRTYGVVAPGDLGGSHRSVTEESERRRGEGGGASTRHDRQLRREWIQARGDGRDCESPVRPVAREGDQDPHDARRGRGRNGDPPPDQHGRHAGQDDEEHDHEDHHDDGQVSRRTGRRRRPHRWVGGRNRRRRDRRRQRDPAVRAELVHRGVRRATTRTGNDRGRAMPPATWSTPNGGKYLRGNVDAVPTSACRQERHI